ncbi:uncharacterized protein LOC121373391 isoform X2 [Gigantopelta aegis]|nr:uncharacterized protein LOC121373391 isoform X2 [Gigantopelta aegis]XP_041355963.1 uncharacterized protein LOC121373391 isoform X2 [Gigantopelta aegis]
MSSQFGSDEPNGDLSKQVNDAISGGDVSRLISLLETRRVDVDSRDVSHDMTTVLMKVCHMNIDNEAQLAILDVLEDLEVNTDVGDAHGRTAVMHSCIGTKPNIVNFLLSLRCDLTLVDNAGNSVLTYAIKSGNIEILESVLEQDAAVELIKKKNNMGLLPLDLAWQTNNGRITKRIEGFQQSVLESEKHHKRKRSKRRNHILLPAVHNTANKPLSTRIVSKHNMSPITMPRILTQRGRCEPEVWWENDIFKDLSSTDIAIESMSPTPVDREFPLYHADKYDSELTGWNSDVMQSNGDITPRNGNLSARGDLTFRTDDLPLKNGNVTARRGDVTSRNGDVTARRGDVTERSTYGKESHSFPKIKVSTTAESVKDNFKCRRDSVSLPDLRDMRRNLVSSGDVTPVSADGLRNHVFADRTGDLLCSGKVGKENRRESILTDLPNLSEISRFKKCDDFRKVGKSKKKCTGEEALHRSLIS